jgi:L-iditol 2-dehydrogenase
MITPGRMRAVQLFAPGDVRCVEVDIPRINRPDEALIRVIACGVCGSDIPRVMSKGAYRYPITIGHEFAGEVVDTGDEAATCRPGDRVTVMPLVNCGVCPYCRSGDFVLCDHYDYYGSRIDGAMAEYIVVRARNVLRLPDMVSMEQGAMTDPVSVALHAVRKAGIQPGQAVAVFGLGAIGQLAVQWLKLLGCANIIAMDILDEKLNLARELGATCTINANRDNAVDAIMCATGGRGADACLEFSGSSRAQVQSIDAVRKAGSVVFCGISYDDLVLPNATLSRILRGELRLLGSWNSSITPLPINEWESSLMSIADGRIRLEALISHHFRLEDCQAAFDMMFQRTALFTKVMFTP